ncbi:uncharacterized protein DUF3224 [Stackebrandtia endophytica]|uniref:Uncharacterized protein DUF3224 n=1 Tax=Stackebrandtia endophytica TaxID=1496996 RepID=A0A543ARW8_9ACTN|nr:DUF3224 domain-containing protein [Stackebrandtia endophytica]TQL75324.1 uncharacterized protein DUF3224 [Stackebrandtia endophytica]
MTERATGTLETKWDEQPAYNSNDGVELAKVVVTKTFAGDIEAESAVEMVKAVTPVPGSAGYVGIERIVGKVGGKSGSFICQHNGIMTKGEARLTIEVVPDSGTGELAGISGQMSINVVDGQHYYEFDYFLDGAA